MIKLLWRFFLVVAAALSFAWLADRPGHITIQWLGREIHLSVLVGIVVLVLALATVYFFWRLIHRILRSPKTIRESMRFRKHRKAYDSLSRGIIAAGAGDAHGAARHAAIAGETLKNEPLITLLAAQAAQLKGDREGVKRAFADMTKAPDTELLGLRGLFSEAKQSGDWATAKQIAERALAKNARLPWASAAILQVQVTARDWAAAATTIANQAKAGLLPKAEAARKQAALLTAQAMADEGENASRAESYAHDALAHDAGLVPAALVAARCHIVGNNPKRAIKILRQTWARAPHPDLADLVANAKPDDDAERKFERVRDLVGPAENNTEGAFALGHAAILAQRWDVARKAIEAHVTDRPQARFCALMAQVEEAQGNAAVSRSWLAKALHAPRDPMWVSDGVALTKWTPVSPVTGEIVPCEWKPPFEVPQGLTWQTPTAPTPALLPNSAEVAKSVQTAPLPDDPGVE